MYSVKPVVYIQTVQRTSVDIGLRIVAEQFPAIETANV